MLLQITWQAYKKVVPLVPVIATSHETRSERIIPLSYIGINTDATRCPQRRKKSNKPKSFLRLNVEQFDETIHEIKSDRIVHFPLLSFWIPTKNMALLQPTIRRTRLRTLETETKNYVVKPITVEINKNKRDLQECL